VAISGSLAITEGISDEAVSSILTTHIAEFVERQAASCCNY
jgi:hypothetical protein